MVENTKGFSWDAMTTKDYIFANIPKIDNEGFIIIKFLEDQPCKISKNKYNTDSFMFNVSIPKGTAYRDNDGDIVTSEGEERVFSISSVRLMEQLKNNLPIKDKTFRIAVSGTGYDTDYAVEVI